MRLWSLVEKPAILQSQLIQNSIFAIHCQTMAVKVHTSVFFCKQRLLKIRAGISNSIRFLMCVVIILLRYNWNYLLSESVFHKQQFLHISIHGIVCHRNQLGRIWYFQFINKFTYFELGLNGLHWTMRVRLSFYFNERVNHRKWTICGFVRQPVPWFFSDKSSWGARSTVRTACQERETIWHLKQLFDLTSLPRPHQIIPKGV